MDAIMARWRRLGTTLTDNAQRIQELMAKLMQFEVRPFGRKAICCLRIKVNSTYILTVSPSE